MSLLTDSPTAKLVSEADHVELSRLIQEFAWRLDHLQAASVIELVTDDIDFRADPANPVIGRDALAAWGAGFDAANPLPGIRHSLSNARFVDEGDGRARGTSMLTAYFTPAGETPTTVPFAIGEDHDAFVRTAEGWKLASRLWVPLAMR